MKSFLTRIILLSILLTLITSYPLQAATERRLALVIGNSKYTSSPLRNPFNDATDMADVLKKLGFKVILKTDASKRDMGKAVEAFGKQLKGQDVSLFFYAGHAIQFNGVNYLIPVGANLSEETDIEYEALDAGRVLAAMYNAKSRVNIVILDACRDNPYARSFRSATRGLAVIAKAPMGTIISYSTSPGDVALDGKGRNSPYTSSLLKYVKEPALSIEQVFKNVRQKLTKETNGKQIPWELSSLQGDFFFLPGVPRKGSVLKDDKSETTSAATYELDDENRQQDVRQDIRFVDNGDGTVMDNQTGLMWAARDNGANINWHDAQSYCENYRRGGYTDWRMPKQDELVGLYGEKSRPRACDRRYENYLATELVDITCFWAWAQETRGSKAAMFNFGNGIRGWILQTDNNGARAIPVRSGKPDNP